VGTIVGIVVVVVVDAEDEDDVGTVEDATVAIVEEIGVCCSIAAFSAFVSVVF
jgi:hypothetical protein